MVLTYIYVKSVKHKSMHLYTQGLHLVFFTRIPRRTYGPLYIYYTHPYKHYHIITITAAVTLMKIWDQRMFAALRNTPEPSDR